MFLIYALQQKLWDPTTQRQRDQKRKRINNFLYISLSFTMLQDYDVKLPNFTFYGGRKQENQETRNFFFLNLDIVPYEFNLRRVRIHLTNKLSELE